MCLTCSSSPIPPDIIFECVRYVDQGTGVKVTVTYRPIVFLKLQPSASCRIMAKCRYSVYCTEVQIALPGSAGSAAGEICFSVGTLQDYVVIKTRIVNTPTHLRMD